MVKESIKYQCFVPNLPFLIYDIFTVSFSDKMRLMGHKFIYISRSENLGRKGRASFKNSWKRKTFIERAQYKEV